MYRADVVIEVENHTKEKASPGSRARLQTLLECRQFAGVSSEWSLQDLIRANLHSRYHLEQRGRISAVVFYGRYKPYEY